MIIQTLWFTYLLPVVDILLIAFVFYQILLLIKGTHSVQVVMGLAVLMGMTLLIRHFLKLPAATWLLENFWSGAVVLLAVVFQPELRTALAHLGSRPLGRLMIPGRLSFVDEIIGTVHEAMQRQMGRPEPVQRLCLIVGPPRVAGFLERLLEITDGA